MSMSKHLIAPCGVNCAVCSGYMRNKNRCSGCLATEGDKVSHCASCRIKLCPEHEKVEFTYCFDCRRFPCVRIKNLDKRYRGKYHASPIENLQFIKEAGMRHEWKRKK